MSREAAIAELTSLLGDRLSRSKPDLAAHGTSEAHYAPAPPDAVAYPETTEEVSALVQICARHGCPVIGWGAGTSLEAQALAVDGGVTVDFSRMNRLIEVHPEDMDCVVQPGITREALDEELRHTGLFFPVDPGANATIGGMASTRASGTTTVRYGNMRANVLGLKVVLADGRIIRTGSRARKSASGYDLTGLFIGAEGTLGLITELTLRLHGRPEAVSSAVCCFNDLGGAVDCVIETIQSGIPMARIEFIDAASAAAFKAYSGMDLPEAPHLLVELHGSPSSVAEEAERFGALVGEHGGTNFRWSDRPEEQAQLWEMRHKAYYALMAAYPGAQGYVTDICVPVSRLAEAVAETRADIAESPLPGPILGHVGDGNFHTTLMVHRDRPEEMAAAHELAHRMAERALRMGGTVTGEHGVGLGKRRYMAEEHGEGWDVMGQIKQALDPHGLMNPGKMLA